MTANRGLDEILRLLSAMDDDEYRRVGAIARPAGLRVPVATRLLDGLGSLAVESRNAMTSSGQIRMTWRRKPGAIERVRGAHRG